MTLVAVLLTIGANAALDGCALMILTQGKCCCVGAQHKYFLILIPSLIALIWVARIVFTVYRLGRLDAVGQVKFCIAFHMQSVDVQCMLHYIMALCGTTLISDVVLAFQAPNFLLIPYYPYGDYGCRALSVIDMFHKAYSCTECSY